MALMIDNTPSAAMPRMRNGSKINQTMGYKSSARITSGQQRTSRISQSRKTAMVTICLAPLASLDGRHSADRRHVVEDGAPGEPRAHTIVRGGDLSVLDQASKLLRRDAEGAYGFFETELDFCGHFNLIIASRKA